MGFTDLRSILQSASPSQSALFSPKGLTQKTPNASPVALAHASPNSAVARSVQPTDVFSPNDGAQQDDQFNSIVYNAQMMRLSVSAQFQLAAARLSGTGGDGASGASVEAQAAQLSFDFYAESRTEELTVFQQRMDQVAQGLEGQRARQESLAQTSQRVAARFSMSVSISGAALNGVAGGAEGLRDNSTAFDDFMKLVNDALDTADDVINQILGMVNDFFSGGGDLQTQLNQLLQGLGDLSQFGAPQSGEQAAPTGNGSNGSQVQFQAFGMRIQIQLEFEFEFESQSGQVVQEGDPLMLDLNGNGEDLTSYTNGARFDLMGTGQAVNTAFVTGGDAFLAMDRNGNGTIDSGRELFGNQNGAANGFEELRKLDTNGDGRINAQDRDFDKLTLWMDNGNGRTEEGELVGLSQAGIKEIGLGYTQTNQAAMGGNRLAQLAYFLRNDGTRGRAADALLNFTA